MEITISDILRGKSNEVISVSPQTKVLDAVHLMNARHVGCVVVLEEQQLAGIFTERDVLVRLVAEGRDPGSTLVRSVMSTSLSTVTPSTPLRDAMDLMTRLRHRHLPVLRDDELLGLVSIGDVNRYLCCVFESEADSLLRYITGEHQGTLRNVL